MLWSIGAKGPSYRGMQVPALIAEIVELQRDLELLHPAQQRHRELQVVALLAGHAQLLALDLGLDLELRALDRRDDLLRDGLLDALLDRDLLLRAREVDLGLADVHRADVDAPRGEPAAQDLEHLLELEVRRRRLRHDEAVARVARIGAPDIVAVAGLANGL